MSSDSGALPPLGGGSAPRRLRRLRKAGATPTTAGKVAAAGTPGDAAAALAPAPGGVRPPTASMDVERAGSGDPASRHTAGMRSASPPTDAAPRDSSVPLSSGGATARRARGATADYWDEEDELVEELERGAARAASPTEDEAGAAVAAPDAPPAAEEVEAAEDSTSNDDAEYSEYSDDESGSMQLDDLHAETARLLRETARTDRLGKGAALPSAQPMDGLLARLKQRRAAAVAAPAPAPPPATAVRTVAALAAVRGPGGGSASKAAPIDFDAAIDAALGAEDAGGEDGGLVVVEEEGVEAEGASSGEEGEDGEGQPSSADDGADGDAEDDDGASAARRAAKKERRRRRRQKAKAAAEVEGETDAPPADAPPADADAAKKAPLAAVPMKPRRSLLSCMRVRPEEEGGGGVLSSSSSGEEEDGSPSPGAAVRAASTGSADGDDASTPSDSGTASSGDASDSEESEEDEEDTPPPSPGALEAARLAELAAAREILLDRPRGGGKGSRRRAPKALVLGPDGVPTGAVPLVEDEAEMSEDGGHSDDGDGGRDDDADAVLADLIGGEAEKAGDAEARASLHAAWEADQADAALQAVLDGVKRGFRRRKRGALDDDDDSDGEGARARRAARRRAGDDSGSDRPTSSSELTEEDDDDDDGAMSDGGFGGGGNGGDPFANLDALPADARDELLALRRRALLERRMAGAGGGDAQPALARGSSDPAAPPAPSFLLDGPARAMLGLLSRAQSAPLGPGSGKGGGPSAPAHPASSRLPGSFGAELTNAPGGSGAGGLLAAPRPSFLGRAAGVPGGAGGASNPGGTRAGFSRPGAGAGGGAGGGKSFVFGTGAGAGEGSLSAQPPADGGRVDGPTSFAGLGSAVAAAGRAGPGVGRAGSGLLSLLSSKSSKKGSGGALDAEGAARLRTVVARPGGGSGV